MEILHLKRPMREERKAIVATQGMINAALHYDAKLRRNGRMEEKRERFEADGYCDVIKDPCGRWVNVFGEFSYCDVI